MKFIIYILILLPWFLSSILFPFDQNFYQSLTFPNFTPPNFVFIIVWPILYILIALSFYILIKKNLINRSILFYYLLNYILNQSFSLFFFYLNNLALTLYTTILLLVSTIFLLISIKKVNKCSFYLLIPYLLWNIFGTILYLAVFFMN